MIENSNIQKFLNKMKNVGNVFNEKINLESVRRERED